jgi:hypothetical protein
MGVRKIIANTIKLPFDVLSDMSTIGGLFNKQGRSKTIQNMSEIYDDIAGVSDNKYCENCIFRTDCSKINTGENICNS